jgi:arylsulfatase
MDQGIGRILKKLDERGATENTLVMFLSDNGGDANPEGATKTPPGPKESAHIYGREWANLSNTPFRGSKHFMYEGGIATPLVVHWPHTIKPRGITHAAGHVIDVMATCIDVADAEYPTVFQDEKVVSLEGKSLLPIFRTGSREGHDALFWEHEGNRAVLAGNWKLVADYKRPWELYDRRADRTELHDLATTEQKVVADLASKYDAWAKQTGVAPWADVRAAMKKK